MNIELEREQSKDDKTNPEILAQLADSIDYLTRQNVAANPNTPTDILLNICWEFPNEVMNNPVIPLLLLENPYVLTCNIKFEFNLDFKYTINFIDREMNRVGWTRDRAINYIFKNYGKKSRLNLTDKELFMFIHHLESLPSNNNQVNNNKKNENKFSLNTLPF